MLSKWKEEKRRGDGGDIGDENDQDRVRLERASSIYISDSFGSRLLLKPEVVDITNSSDGL
jgi:hypothetical protein